MEFDFSKNKTVTDINKVPEDFRGLYIESDDDYSLNSEDAGVKSAVAAITRLNKSLQAARKEAKGKTENKVDLSILSDYGDNPDAIAEAVTSKLKELTDELAKGGDAKLNLEKIKEDLAKAHAKDLKTKDTKNEALGNQLHKLLVENAAVSAITEQKGIARFLMPLVKEQVKVVEENGEFSVFVVDGSGDRRYSGVTGEPMTIKELVKDMKANEEFGSVFESDSPSGGGIKPGSTSGKTISKQGGHELSSTEKIAKGLASQKR